MGGATTDPTRQIEVYAINADNTLRWITNVTTLRAPYGRYILFVQKDVIARLPIATTGGPISIVDNHLGKDFGAPRQLYVHMSNRQGIFTRKRHVQPIPRLCGRAVHTPRPPLAQADR